MSSTKVWTSRRRCQLNSTKSTSASQLKNLLLFLSAKTLEVKAIGDLMPQILPNLLKSALRCTMILRKRLNWMFLVSVAFKLWTCYHWEPITEYSTPKLWRLCVSTKIIGHSMVYRLQRIWKRTFNFFSEEFSPWSLVRFDKSYFYATLLETSCFEIQIMIFHTLYDQIILPQKQDRSLKTYILGINVHKMFKSLFLQQQSILRHSLKSLI